MANWYYEVVIKDGKRTWEKVFREEEETFSEVRAPLQKEPAGDCIELRAEDFQEGDLVEVTHHPPPPSVQDCKPFSEFLKELEEYMKDRPPKEFKPHIFWNSYWRGGMLEILWKDSPYYVDYGWNNKHIARCLDMETEELVGIKVEGIANLKLGVEQSKNIS